MTRVFGSPNLLLQTSLDYFGIQQNIAILNSIFVKMSIRVSRRP